jgi:hypothetical protein
LVGNGIVGHYGRSKNKWNHFTHLLNWIKVPSIGRDIMFSASP